MADFHIYTTAITMPTSRRADAPTEGEQRSDSPPAPPIRWRRTVNGQYYRLAEDMAVELPGESFVVHAGSIVRLVRVYPSPCKYTRKVFYEVGASWLICQ